MFSVFSSLMIGRRGDLLAMIAGLLLPFAFAPYGLFPLAVISQALLYMLWRKVSPGRGFWRGWLYGLGMFGAGVYWVQISIHQFGLPVLAFSVSMTVLFVAFLALYPALAGWGVARLAAAGQARHYLWICPVAWTLVEWLRGWLFTGFPWLDLGYSQIDSPLRGYAPILGVYGITLLTAISGGALPCLLRRPLSMLILLVAVWAGGGLLAGHDWTRPAAAPFKVALLQGGIAQSVKWDPAQRDATIKHYLKLSAGQWDSRLIVWPETAVPAFYTQMRPFLAALTQRALATGTDVLIGLPYDEETDHHDRYYNSIMSIGATPGRYDKRHLVPFGEYLPFDAWLRPMLDFLKIPMSDFSAGTHDPVTLTAAGIPVGISICYEDAFGDEVARALPAAELLVNVSDDAWFGDSVAPHQHLQMARMRALETGRYLLRATNDGITAIIRPSGRIAARAPQFVAYTLAGEAQARTGATPYVRWGNRPIVGLLLLAGIAMVLVAWRARLAPNRR